MNKTATYQWDELIALLQWYKSAGVDICLNETCNNHFLERPAPIALGKEIGILQNPTERKNLSITSPITNNSLTMDANVAPTSNPLTSVPDLSSPKTTATTNPSTLDGQQKAQELAKSANSLEELQTFLENFDGCALKERASQLVFASGSAKAKIMFVGKAPGNDEDMLGTPFAGKAGALLDAMLDSISLKRSEVFLSNMVPWRPPGNRDPAPQEISTCLPFLIRQIELVEPDFIIAMGNAVTKALMGKEKNVLKLDGKPEDIKVGTHKSKIIATLHPQFLLRQPAQKRRAWRDLCNLRQALNEK